MVFLSAAAPTTSFWDCGEFIAASYTLGVPHPPGAPLYLLIGRLFSMLPLAEDIGRRVNLISVLVSALTVMLLYLCIVRLARIWRGEEKTVSDKIAVYGSAAVGALALAFSHSFWFNAVEAEVYSISMFFTALVFYLALRWLDSSDTPTGNRILLFIFYLIGLSSGIHLLNVLALMSITYIVAFKKIDEFTFGKFIITGIVGSVVILVIYPGIIQGLPTLIAKSGSFSYGSVIILLILLVWATIEFVRRDKRLPALASLSALLVILGYSTYLIIKIRSGQNPFLDENDPETWSRLLSYLNREQYGSESLFLTIFDRKAPFWSYQIDKMYIRYFGWQFFEPARFFMLPFLLGIVGAVHHFFRDKKSAFVVLILFFMTGLAIILYLNQPDPQPRERDYSYVGSFFAFAIWIGLGALALVEIISESLKSKKLVVLAGSVIAICLIAVPLNMFIKNYESHSRAGNYVAWDYSYNLLNTCAKDAILFTNGDNDTFPLWYLQTVDGVRTDVRVVNLSLFNTGWFIKQIRDKEPKVPLPAKITDDYIDNVIESREVEGLLHRKWQERRKVRIAGPTADDPGMVWEVPATLSYPLGAGQTGHFLRVQDFMILNAMVANNWKLPIYFAVTVSDQNLIGLRSITDTSRNFLRMEGLAFRVMPHPTDLIDPELMAKNLMQNYKYRNLNNPDVHYDGNILKLLGNYRQGLLQLALHYMTKADQSVVIYSDTLAERGLSLSERIERFDELSPRTKALTALEFMEEIIPEEYIPIRHELISIQLGRLYSQLGYPERTTERLDRLVEQKDLTPQKALEYGTYYLSDARNPERARELFDFSLQHNRSLENLQRIAYTWIQLSDDTTYAADLFRRFLEMDDNHQSRLRIASQALMFGLDGLAFSIYEPMLQINPEDGEAVRGMVEYYQRTGDYKRSLNLVDSWIVRHPDDPVMNRKRNELSRLAGKTASE